MSSELHNSNAVPRWQQAIEKAIEQDHKSTIYQLATVETNASQTLAVPHVRSVVHRAFFAPLGPAHPLLLTSTDIRTPKARQVAQNARVEIAWWVAQTQEQFRITGRAHVLSSPAFTGTAARTAEGEAPLPGGETAQIEEAARKLAGVFPGRALGGANVDWEAKRVDLFEEMSGHMKASWVRPVPGTPLPGGYGAGKAWPVSLPRLGEAAEGEERGMVEEAMRNFALVVIDPIEVDYVELDMIPNQRTRFFKDGEGNWKEEILVP